MSEAEFQAFYLRTSRPLWAYVFRTCGDASLADDILQEAFCRFLNARLTEPDFSRLKSYLYRIATNLVTDHWRKAKKERAWGERNPPAERGDVDDSARLILKADFGRSFRLLKPRERALLWLAYVEGAAHREIADCLGLSERSIRVLLFRARRKMADILRRQGLNEAL